MGMRTRTLEIPHLYGLGSVTHLGHDMEEGTFIERFLCARAYYMYPLNARDSPVGWVVVTSFPAYTNVRLGGNKDFSMISWLINSGTGTWKLSSDLKRGTLHCLSESGSK